MYSKLVVTPFVALALAGSMQAQRTEQPNIILFLVDDMGWQETSVPFHLEETALNHRYRTPNMERMARLGVKFTQAYACAISSPSRCSLMTGMNAARHRVTNWTLRYNQKTDAKGGSLDLPDWNFNGLQPDTVTAAHDLTNTVLATALPEVLKRAGYYTIHCGKAHFGAMGTAGENPLAFGFDVNIGGGANGAPGSYLAQNEYGQSDFHVQGLEEYYAKGTFLTEALTIEALKAVQKPVAEGKPFYLYMSHYAIHSPYDADPRFTSNYRDADGQGVYDEQLSKRLNNAEVNHAALVEGMDESLGRLLDWLDQNPKVAQNTIVLFMSDNGGQAVGVRQGRADYDQNFPARAGKGSSYLGGVREPMMVYWPGVVQGGTTNSNVVMIEDFFPTIAEMAGADVSACSQTIDGKSFAGLLRDKDLQRNRTLIWHFPNLWGESQNRAEGYGAYSAILRDNYHLIYFWETQERRLYDVSKDVAERHNLADEMPELTLQLAAELTDSLISYGAQRPTLKATGIQVPWPVDGQLIPSVGDVVSPMKTGAFIFSTEDMRHYYRIADNRPSAAGGPFYWTMGSHNGYKALQCNNRKFTADNERKQQLFYMLPGKDDKHFRLFTYDGQAIDYVDGLTGGTWNGGNVGNALKTPFLQYGTEESGQFQIVKSDNNELYGFSADGQLLNDRGTANGAAANMKWVINTYAGNSVKDAGSVYRFISEGSESTGINSLTSKDNLSVKAFSRYELSQLKEAKVYSLDGKKVHNVYRADSGVYAVKYKATTMMVYLHD